MLCRTQKTTNYFPNCLYGIFPELKEKGEKIEWNRALRRIAIGDDYRAMVR